MMFSSPDYVNQVSIKHCSRCQENTEYYCRGCQLDLCIQCKERHVIHLSTKEHEVMSYFEKMKYVKESAKSQHVVKHEVPTSDPSNNQDVLCSPVWLSPSDQSEKQRRQYSSIIFYLRSETIYNRCATLEVIKRNITNIHTKVTKEGQSAIGKLAEKVKEGIDNFLAGNIEDRSILQKIRMTKHMTKLAKHMYRYEQLETIMKYKPVKFVQIITQKRQPMEEQEKRKHRQNRKQKIMVSIIANEMKNIRFVENGRCLQPGIELLLTLLPSAIYEKSVILKDVDNCGHIFSASPDRVWVSDVNNLILVDTAKGERQHSVGNSLKDSVGKHTMNSHGHLIYIDENYDIMKISGIETTPLIVLKNTDSTWKPKCVFSSNVTGDLLVGMVMEGTETGKITRYDNEWGLTQTITLESTPHSQYRSPAYITENNNGDIVVSDDRAVVVTSREGKYRFSYTGPTSEYKLLPRGICTDVFSNILVCDAINYTIHMIDKDGQFLSHLLTVQSEGLTNHPWSLSYDDNTHLLFVGSCNEVLFVYRYINRHIHLTYNNQSSTDVSSYSVTSSRVKNLPGWSEEEHNSGIYEKEIERSKEMTKESANRAVEKAKVARRAAQAVNGTGQETAIQATDAALKAIEAAKQNLETVELIVGAITYMGEQQQLTQPVLDAKVKEKGNFKAAKQNIETGELMKCVMEGIEGLQKVTKRVSNFQAKEKTTPSLEVEDVGKTGIAAEDAENAVYMYRDSKSES